MPPLRLLNQPKQEFIDFSKSGVPPNSVLFGRTVPPNSVLFGGTVPPNSFPLFELPQVPIQTWPHSSSLLLTWRPPCTASTARTAARWSGQLCSWTWRILEAWLPHLQPMSQPWLLGVNRYGGWVGLRQELRKELKQNWWKMIVMIFIWSKCIFILLFHKF